MIKRVRPADSSSAVTSITVFLSYPFIIYKSYRRTFDKQCTDLYTLKTHTSHIHSYKYNTFNQWTTNYKSYHIQSINHTQVNQLIIKSPLAHYILHHFSHFLRSFLMTMMDIYGYCWDFFIYYPKVFEYFKLPSCMFNFFYFSFKKYIERF